MAIIDFVKWDGTPDIYAYKFPNDNLSTWTQLVVNESQEAVLFSKGKIIAKFGAGKHTLSTENIPLLRELFGIPFGGRNPFTAEIWFVNKTIALDIKWGTANPIQVEDQEFHIMVPVRANGQFGIQIADSEKFLVKLVGTLSEFNRDKLTEYFKGILLTNLTDIIAKKIVIDKISVLKIGAFIKSISNFAKEQMKKEFDEFGILLTSFYINSINLPEDDPSVKKLKDALAKKAEMNIIGYNYQQERAFDVLENAAKNEGGSSSNVMGAGIGIGMGFGIGGMMSNMVGNILNPNISKNTITCPNCNTPNFEGAKFCSNCGKELNNKNSIDISNLTVICDKCKNPMPLNSKFCPNCGDPYNPCLECGADIPENATICPKCGKPAPTRCPNCNTIIQQNLKFCPNCGKSLSIKCQNCGYITEQKIKFCPQCGNKLDV